MKRFRFRLEPALRLKEFAERQAEAALMEGEAAVQRVQAARIQLENERQQHFADSAILREEPRQEIGMLIALERWADWLDERAKQLEEELAAAQLQRDVLRARLVVCRREREALETLRTQQEAEHSRLAAVAEQAALDESAVLRWGRVA